MTMAVPIKIYLIEHRSSGGWQDGHLDAHWCSTYHRDAIEYVRSDALACANEQLRMAKQRLYELGEQLINLASATRFDPMTKQWVITEQDAAYFKVEGFLSKSEYRRNDPAGLPLPNLSNQTAGQPISSQSKDADTRSDVLRCSTAGDV